MWKIIYSLSITLIFVNGQLIDGVLRWILKNPKYSLLVPVWRYTETDSFVCKQPGYYADLKNCKYFYECTPPVAGYLNRLVFKCIDDHVYSIAEKGCVPPAQSDRAECGGVMKQTIQLPLLNHENDSFSIEINNKNQDNYDEETRTITVSTDLSQEEYTYESKTDYTERNEIEEPKCSSEGYFLNPNDCSKFYRCVPFGYELIKYDFSCPRGTIWDERLETCNFYAAVKWKPCKENNLSLFNPTKRFPPGIEIACPIANITGDRTFIICPSSFRSHPKYCNVFYQCSINDNLEVNFKAFLCHENMTFDEEKLQCVNKKDTHSNDCTYFLLEGKLPSVPIIKAPRSRLCPSEGQFPYSENCSNNYFKCERGEHGILQGYLFQCSPDQVYSPTSNSCESSAFFPSCAKHLK